ncbi:DNA polymerase III subunit epsilon [Azospirillum rugosum]|uniref:DNA polymerase III subunit epsilon n=1 Tax=Azospirillum rugosum TaxID=416170 RepID=A0ABS4SN12_9PROT|nr:DNA polymerase III subunit epsilon [Azospirillum rugosum]MBP2293877.1 DNA polymerase-3 subunit epsilon [Azospirillum rugosum]MDQ0526936.1 DNA polymerase-3 subunit epsilon [Azospirillum rugosum]
MREIVLDTETTGFKPEEGHRLIEIGCVELVNHVATGRNFHRYINPERDVPADAVAVHGLTGEFLADKPLFNDVVADFVEFIGDAPLVIHNAAFDMNFLNWELKIAGYPVMPKDRAVDTLMMARQKFPGAPATLDALCKRFGIDNSSRTYHGALLDAQLLAEVYLELLGGRQAGLALSAGPLGNGGTSIRIDRPYRAPRPHAPSEEELLAHAELLTKLKNPLWAAE